MIEIEFEKQLKNDFDYVQDNFEQTYYVMFTIHL